MKKLIQRGAEKNGFWSIKPSKVHELAEILEGDVYLSDSSRNCETRRARSIRLTKIFKKVFYFSAFLLILKKKIAVKNQKKMILNSKPNAPLPKENCCRRIMNNPRRMLYFYCLIIGAASIGVFIYGFFYPPKELEKAYDALGLGLCFAFAGKFGSIFILDVVFVFMYRDLLMIFRKFSFFGKYFSVLFNEHFTIHKFSAYILVLFVTIHALGHLLGTFIQISEVNNLEVLNSVTTEGKFDSLPSYPDILFKSIPGITGIIMLLIIYLMFISTFDCVKKKNYQIFAYTHILYIPLCILLYLHGCLCLFNYGKLLAIPYITPFLAITFLHHMKKWLQCMMNTPILDVSFSAKNSVAYIKILKPKYCFKITPGQYLYLNVPTISYFQWHPFSICSIGYNGVLKLMVKNAGDFTNSLLAHLFKAKTDFILEQHLEVGTNKKFQKLFYNFLLKEAEINKLVKKENKASLPNYPKVHLYGPIGSPAVGSSLNPNVIFIGSGVGIAPYIVFLDEYINHLKSEKKFNPENNLKTTIILKTEDSLLESEMRNPSNLNSNNQMVYFLQEFERIGFYYIARDCDQLSWITYYIIKLIKYGYNPEKLDIKLFLTTENSKQKITTLDNFLFWRALGKYQNLKEKSFCKSCIDFLTNIPIEVAYKRPDFEKCFEESRKQQKSSKDCYVYGCGPKPLLHSIGKTCEKVNRGSKTKFIFFPEKF